MSFSKKIRREPIPFTSHVAPVTVVSHNSAGGPSNTGFPAFLSLLSKVDLAKLSTLNQEMNETVKAYIRLHAPKPRGGPYLRKVKLSLYKFTNTFQRHLEWSKEFTIRWPVPDVTLTEANIVQEFTTVQQELLESNEFAKMLHNVSVHLDRIENNIIQIRKITREEKQMFMEAFGTKGEYENILSGPTLTFLKKVRMQSTTVECVIRMSFPS